VRNETDGDIKIFNAASAAAQPVAEELDALALETEAQRANGNLGRAKQLGRALSSFSAHSPELLALAESFGFALSPEREQHLHVLMLFSAQSALQALLWPKLLAETAITAMNNALINHEKAFWDTVSDGRVFTQYLLALRSPASAEESAERIGEVFAQVCGQEDNPDLHALGGSIFTTAHKWVAANWELEARD
jgi:hypothetical protein